MALTDPTYRFTGFNPRQQGGIIDSLRPPPQSYAAARPLQVAALQPVGARGRIIASAQEDYQRRYDALTRRIEAAESERAPDEKIQLLRDAQDKIVADSNQAGRPVKPSDDEGALTSDVKEALTSIEAAVAPQAAARAEEVGAPPEAAAEARNTARNTAEALTGDIKTQADFDKVLEVLGGPGTDPSKLNDQAKEMLGIDKNEADVPAWAAPMFLFGLNLMKGPVSSKVEGQTGLGGLMSDIGAAGEKGFAIFASERARKKKEKATIAQVALKIRDADLAQKKLLVTAYRDQQKDALNLDQTVANWMDKTLGRAQSLAGSGDDPKIQEQRLRAYHSVFGTVRELAGSGVTGRHLLKPTVTAGILARVAADIGVRTPDANFIIRTLGDVNYMYDPGALERATKVFNKENNLKIEAITLFGMIIAQDPRVTDPKYQGLITGGRKENISFTTQSRIGLNGEKVTDHIYTDKGELGKWKAKFEQDNGRAPTPKEVAANLDKFRGTVQTFLTDSPLMNQSSFKGEDGVEHNFYWNPAAFANRRRSNPDLTLQQVLLDQKKYPGIISGETKDLSALAPNIATITVGTGPYTKRVLNFDRGDFGRALRPTKGADGREIPAAINLKKGNIIEQIIDLGIGGWAGAEWSTREASTMSVISADGSVMIATGVSPDKMIRGLANKQEEVVHRNRTLGLVQLHRLAHQIDPLLRDLSGRRVASTITDVGNFFESSVDLITGLFGKKVNPAQINGFASGKTNSLTIGNRTIVNDLTKSGRELLQNGLDTLRNGTLIFGGVAIKDKVNRARVESMFINLAFALASTREGGKLTDNDVKNALATLGWDDGSFSQTPEAVLGTLRGAVKDASNSYFEAAVLGMSEPELAKHAEKVAAGEGDVVEQLLRRFAKASDPPMGSEPGTPMYNLYRSMQGTDQPYRISYHRQPGAEQAAPGPTKPGPIENKHSYSYRGKTITYIGAPISETEATTLTVLEKKRVPRTAAGIKIWIEGLPEEVRIRMAPIIKSLEGKGFFN